MTDYNVLLERLKRHYYLSVKYYDKVSLYDLAHVLRIWTEVKGGIDEKYGMVTFKKNIRTRSLKKIFSGSDYVYAYLPGGVTTSANSGRVIFGGSYVGKMSVGGKIEIHENKDLTLYQIFMIRKVLSPDEIKLLSDESKRVPIEKVSFSRYMESSAINFQFLNCKLNSISNEKLVKRIANEYEASHAGYNDTMFKTNNHYSEIVESLMGYKVGQLPLPYFVVLHIAKTIVDNLDGQV